MKLQPLSDGVVAEHAVVCWEALEEHGRRSFQLVAQASQRDTVRQIVEWLYGKCEHPTRLVATDTTGLRINCWKCRQELKGVIDKEGE